MNFVISAVNIQPKDLKTLFTKLLHEACNLNYLIEKMIFIVDEMIFCDSIFLFHHKDSNDKKIRMMINYDDDDDDD